VSGDDEDWRVQLTGHAFDIDEVEALLSTQGFAIEQQDSEWFLSGPALSVCETSRQAQLLAINLIETSNAVLSLSRSDYRPIQVGAKILRGDSINIAVLAATAELRTKALGVGVVTSATQQENPQPPRPYERQNRWMEAARRASEVEAVLNLFISGTDNPLWRAFERIRKDLGGDNQVRQFMDWGKTRYSRFRKTLNSPRHELEPPSSLPHPEAESMARELCHKWLDIKSAAQ